MVSKDPAPGFDAPNIRRIERYLDEEEVIRLQNEHLFHLCVSRAEGFGHKLNEGMSCGAIVIATDAPPMNELITPERGLLVKYSHSERMNAGTAYDFDEADLERTIEKCLRLTTPEIEQLSRNARRWFEDNDRYFRARLPEALRELA
jgi:glycosyltransferase involved in cell wall biosynthesis